LQTSVMRTVPTAAAAAAAIACHRWASSSVAAVNTAPGDGLMKLFLNDIPEGMCQCRLSHL